MGLWLDGDNFQLAHIYVKIQMFEKISVKKDNLKHSKN